MEPLAPSFLALRRLVPARSFFAPGETSFPQSLGMLARVSAGYDVYAPVMAIFIIIHNSGQIWRPILPGLRPRFLFRLSHLAVVVIFRNDSEHRGQRVASSVGDGRAHGLRLRLRQGNYRKAGKPFAGFSVNQFGFQANEIRPQMLGGGNGALDKQEPIFQKGIPA